MSQVVDLDNSLEVTRQELGKLRGRADEEDERWRAREQELLVRLEDSRCRERKLEDQKHNLEVCLADATQQLQELKVFSRKMEMFFRSETLTDIREFSVLNINVSLLKLT